MYIKNTEDIFNEDELFYCYSESLKDHLENNGVKYVYKLKNEGKNKCWIFLRSDRFLEVVKSIKDSLVNKEV